MTSTPDDSDAAYYVVALRALLEHLIGDDEIRSRIGVALRDGTPTVYYRVIPAEKTDPGSSRIPKVMGIVTGGLVGAETNVGEVEFITVASDEEGGAAGTAWTITAGAAEDVVRGRISKEMFFEQLNVTQRAVDLDEPPI